MQKEITLKCASCGHKTPYQLKLGNCPKCGGDWLDPLYNLAEAREVWLKELATRPGTMWRYWELLPLLNKQNIISMGEGYTPLLPLTNLA